MKTRAEIYSKEAADILRNITTYHYMRHDQLCGSIRERKKN